MRLQPQRLEMQGLPIHMSIIRAAHHPHCRDHGRAVTCVLSLNSSVHTRQGSRQAVWCHG